MHILLLAKDRRKVPKNVGIRINNCRHFGNEKNRNGKGQHERLFDKVKCKNKRS